MFGMHWQCNWIVAWTSSGLFAHVCGQKADTSSNYCDNIQPHDKRRFIFLVKCDTIFRLFFFGNYHNFILLTSQGCAATYWRYGGKYYMGFAGNLLGFPAMKEFWKSVKNWQSYCHEFGVQFFWATLYMFTKTSHLVFAARCYASAAYVVVRCLSVRLCISVSVTFVHSVKINKRIFNFFKPSGSRATRGFPYRTSWQYIPTGTPVTGASNVGGVCRNRYSEPISGFIACCEPLIPLSMTLSDL